MKKKYLKDSLPFILTFFIFYSSAFCQSGLIEAIYFKSNSFSIDKKYERTLNFITKQLSSDTFRYLKIFGYADTKGSDDYNDILSGKRANAVYDYLALRAKIDTTKVYVTGIGKSGQDVAYDLHFPGAHIRKRCVDIWVTFYRKSKIGNPK